jgi:hypothetical protein
MSPIPGMDTAAACGQLSELLLHLQQIQSAVVVSAAALRRQNCELDDDIANVLQRSVADKIQDQIERVEGTLRLLARGGGSWPATATQSDSRYNAGGQQQ